MVFCPHCNAAIEHNWSNYVVSSYIVDADREMGSEVAHSIECDEFDCPNCEKKFGVTGFVTEYPEGAYNYHELETSAIER